MVEHLPSKQEVSGSTPDTGFFYFVVIRKLNKRRYLFKEKRKKVFLIITIITSNNKQQQVESDKYFNTKIITQKSPLFLQQQLKMSYYYRDSLSIRTNKILANLLAQLVLLSEKVESFRQIIASVPYYDCVELFRVLDRGSKGYLTVKDFEYLIGQNHSKIVTYAFGWFDQAKLGEVSRLEFIAFLMPRRNFELRQLVARRIQQPVEDDTFSESINQQLRIYTELLNQMISHELKIIQQRNLLVRQQDYSLKGVLNSLDINAHKFVSTNDILKFLQNYAIQATQEQINDFLEIVDSKLQGKITLDQLSWIVEGLEISNPKYRQQVKKSAQKKTYSKKSPNNQNHNQQSTSTPKEFVRTPFKTKQSNYQPISIQNSKVSQSNQKKLNSSAKIQKNNPISQLSQIQKYAKNQPHLQTKQISRLRNIQNAEFQLLLKKYKQAESQAIRKDADLIIAEQQIKQKLRQEFYQRSNSRRRAITEYDSIASQSRRKPILQKQPGNLTREDFIRPNVPIQSIKRQEYPIRPVQYNYPYTSQYDKKINTIVENFYRRNKQTLPLHYSQKRYGTISNSFYEKQTDLSKNSQPYGRNSSMRKTFLDDQLYEYRARVKPFDHGSTFIKEEINKKLGDEIYKIKFPSRNHDPLAYQLRQKPQEENIKRVKQNTDNIEQRERISSKNGMMQNISIISKETNKNVGDSGQKSSQKRDLNVFRTDVKQKPMSTPSQAPAYQIGYSGGWTKSRGQQTTGTKYPYGQSGDKMSPSLLRIDEENGLR